MTISYHSDYKFVVVSQLVLGLDRHLHFHLTPPHILRRKTLGEFLFLSLADCIDTMEQSTTKYLTCLST